MSQRHPIVLAGYLALVVAAVGSLVVLKALAIRSTGQAMLLGIWLLLPYAALTLLLASRAPRASEIGNGATALLVASGGLLFLVLIVFVNPDPQGGIAVMFTPLYQGMATIILLPLTRWLAHRGERGADPGGTEI